MAENLSHSDDGADTHESRIGAVDSSGARIALLRNLFSLTEPECVRALGTRACWMET